MEDLKEMFREVIKELVTDDAIASVIRSEVRDRFNYQIRQEIEIVVHSIVGEHGREYIKEQVDAAFAKPVKKDDGWGNVEYYDSFDALVRDSIHKELSSRWEVGRQIENIIRDKMRKYAADIEKIAEVDLSKKVMERMVEDLTAKKD